MAYALVALCLQDNRQVRWMMSAAFVFLAWLCFFDFLGILVWLVGWVCLVLLVSLGFKPF
jgi:hypothetical protein